MDAPFVLRAGPILLESDALDYRQRRILREPIIVRGQRAAEEYAASVVGLAAHVYAGGAEAGLIGVVRCAGSCSGHGSWPPWVPIARVVEVGYRPEHETSADWTVLGNAAFGATAVFFLPAR